MALISHIRGLAWLHVIYGGISFAIGIVLLSMPPIDSQPSFGYWGLIGRTLLIVGPLRIIAGWALLRLHWWSRPLVFMISVIGLFEAPLGTLLAVYSFFILFNKDFSSALRENPPRS